MQISIDPQDREFLEQLHQLGPSSIQEICEVTGVTATAVRQRLMRLEGRNFVTRETIREGRGRPHHMYRLTEVALRNLGDNYSDLAIILWREVMRIDDREVREQVLANIKQALIGQYQRSSMNRSVLERFIELRNALSDRGFQVEIDKSGTLPILRENNCPYHELASEDSSICELENAVFEEILGTRIQRTQCCLEGHHCCEFEPIPETA